ncbi:hypothetical protein LCGC14_0358420 [marine sediment metagenome]|uniref:Uncharacterized protein n=1 Tax=marine sediment metagenome TaxID=412755 RepID=A0A0F9TRJ1_9ZZZZ
MAKTLFGDDTETTAFGDAVETPNAAQEPQPLEPQDAFDRAGKVWDTSIDLEVPLGEVKENWDIFTVPKAVDPATSGMGSGDGEPQALVKNLFARPYLAFAEAFAPGARRGFLSLVDSQLPQDEFTAHGGLADEIEQAPWYKKLPEVGGWVSEKALEFKTLGFLFKAVGLSSLFNTLGSKLASRIAGREIAKLGGKKALLTYGGWNTFRTRVLTSIAKTAPENMAFMAAWQSTEAARRGEPIGPAARKGAIWGLGFSVAIPLIAEGAKAGMSTKVFEKAALKLQAKFPKLADFLAGKPEKEFIDATIESLREEAVVAGVEVPSEIVFSKLTPQAQAIVKGLARNYKKAWIKAQELDAASKRYWAAGIKDNAEVSKLAPTKPTAAPTEAAAAPRPAGGPLARAPVAAAPAEAPITPPKAPAAAVEPVGAKVPSPGAVEKKIAPAPTEGKVVAFHGTRADIKTFKPLSHFGTEKAAGRALESVKGKGKEKIIPVELALKNPLEVKDTVGVTEDVIDWVRQAEDLGVVSEAEADSIENIVTETGEIEEANKAFIKLLKSKGYDGLKYINKTEDKGSTSYVIFDSGQVKIAQPPTAKEPTAKKELAELTELPQTKLKAGAEKVYQDTINRFASLENIVTKAKKLGATIPAGEDTGKLARSYLGIGGKAQAMLEKETFIVDKAGNIKITGEGFKPIVTSIDKALKKSKHKNYENDFEDYLINTRTVSDLQRPKVEGKEGLIVSPKQIKAAEIKLSELKEKYGDDLKIFESHAKRLYDYQKRVLHLLVDAGTLSQEKYDAIVKSNQHYIPFDRVLPEDTFTGGMPVSKKRFTEARTPIRKIKGSEKPIENVFESVIKNTYKILNTAERNKVAASVYNLKDILPESIQKISPKFFPIKVSDDLTTFRPSPFKPTGTVIEVYINGKRKFMQVTPNIHDAMTGLTEPGIGLLTKIFSKPAHWLRVGATITPEFITRNPIRDQWTAFMQTNTGFVPFVDTLGAMSDLWGKSADYYEWLETGGTYSGFVEFTRPQLEKTYSELIGKKGLLKRLNIIHTAQDISQFFEQATRLGIFKAAKKKGLPALESGFAAREGTLDFMRRGAKTKDVNAVIAFFNAGVQAADKMARVAASDPIGFAMKGFAAITIPSLLLYLRNRKDPDYKEIPRWQRDLFWLIKIRDTWVRIPKPFAYGQIFGSLPERFFEYLDTKDKAAFEKIAKSLLDSLSPVSGDPASGLMPTALKPLVENTANWNFFTDRPIVPKGKERLLPEAQYTKFTSRTARELGDLFDYPPVKIENLLRGYLGGTGKYILDAGDVLINQIKDDSKGLEPKPLKTIADIPLIRGFVARGIIAGQSESLNKFYEKSKQVMAATQTTKAYFNRDDLVKAKETLAEHKPDIETSKIFDGAQQYITKLNDGIDQILSSDVHTNKQKGLAIEELERVKVYIAKRALAFYEYKEDKKITKTQYQSKIDRMAKVETDRAISLLNELKEK